VKVLAALSEAGAILNAGKKICILAGRCALNAKDELTEVAPAGYFR
jgi:thiamine pyrophosphate-dependent acetolactate synthase large subunit-like protein